MIDIVVSEKLKTDKDVILAVEISLKVDIEDVQKAARRAIVIGKAYKIETIGLS
ncbi:MAG: hypothetical protein N3A59_06245 [Thermodesulfovibrionales bacterium]|nr:hypothetical protein [Thermodesulfovibrionales bacterium]